MTNPFDNDTPNQLSAIGDAINQQPRIVQCIQAVNEELLIEACMLQVYDKVDKIIVIEGAVQSKVDAKQATPDGHSLDRTVEIVRDVKENKDPDNKILFIQIDKPWQDLEELKNTFFSYMNEGDWMLITDVDEFIHPSTVDDLRLAISLQPWATEFIPTFYHFWRDHRIIKSPDHPTQNWNFQHQRFIKFQPGLHYRTHPVATDKDGTCTYFGAAYTPRRFVLPSFKIFHYSYMNFKTDSVRDRREYYKKELGQAKHGHVGAVERDQMTDEFLDYTEDKQFLLAFEEEHPDIIQHQEWFVDLDEKVEISELTPHTESRPYGYEPNQIPLLYAWMVKEKRCMTFCNTIEL